MNNDFNSHTREGVTYDAPRDSELFSNFNSHTREGVTCEFNGQRTYRKFQLTHP